MEQHQTETTEGHLGDPSVNVEQEAGEQEEEKLYDEEEEFENSAKAIIEKLRALPSDASEIKVEAMKRDSKAIYKKLCKALKVPENSAFLSNLSKESMDFSYHCLGPVGIIPVAKALTINTSIKEVNFRYNELGAKSLPAITLLLDQNENIVRLNLSSNNIGKNSANALNELIKSCYFVEFLDLSDNELGDEELLEIGSALMKVDNLKELNLSKNDFSSTNAPAFASCLSKCASLLKLDLSSNHFEDGATNIFNCLKILNLTHLNFAKNGVMGDSMQTLAGALRVNKVLKEFDLSFNYISSKGAILLATGLKGNSTLETFRIAYNPIMGSAATVVVNAIASGNLKLLDMSGIRVNLAFFKTLRNYNKSGKEVKILFGSEIRFASLPRDHFTPAEDEIPTRENALMLAQRFADDKGVSLRAVLKNIHANFITEQHEKFVALQESDPEEKDKPRESARMTVEVFARGLVASDMAVPRAFAQELAELFADPEGFVDMWRILGQVHWRPDDLNVKIKKPKKTPPPDDKSKKGKNKGFVAPHDDSSEIELQTVTFIGFK